MCYFYKMEINQDTIDKLAVLSRLEFTGEEQEALKTDLQHMLQFVNKLNELAASRVRIQLDPIAQAQATLLNGIV